MDRERISCCSIALHDREPEYVFRVFAEAGYGKVDLLGRMPHFDLSNPDYDFENVMAAAEKASIRISNLGSYCGDGFVSDDPEVREQALQDTKAVIDAAAACGARSIRTRAGHPEDPNLIDRLVPYYQQAAEYAEQKGVYMGVENHGGAISGNPELLAEFFRKVGNEHAGVLYEPCNLAMAGVDYKKAFETMKEHITHCHVKDCYEIEGKMRVVWLGTGIIDYRWVTAALEGSGYDGDYAIEYEVRGEPPEEGVGKWLDWFSHI